MEPNLLEQLDEAVLAAHSKHKTAENFASSIKTFIKEVDSRKNITLSMICLCNEFHFQRRRLYDVINVLEALDFCKKTGVDEMVWYGKESFKRFILDMKQSRNFDTDSFEQCISIGSLTIRFIKLFFIFGLQKLNIKDIGKYLSKDNGRMKTTVCKLYQISHILEAAGVVEKTVLPGEIKLVDEFYFVDEQTQIDANQANEKKEVKAQKQTQQTAQVQIKAKPKIKVKQEVKPVVAPQQTFPIQQQQIIVQPQQQHTELKIQKVPFTIEQLLNTPAHIKPAQEANLIDNEVFASNLV